MSIIDALGRIYDLFLKPLCPDIWIKYGDIKHSLLRAPDLG